LTVGNEQDLAETPHKVERLENKGKRGDKEPERQILEQLTLGPSRFSELTHGDRTLERTIKKLEQNGVIKKLGGHFARYVLPGYEEGVPAWGTQRTVTKFALEFYQNLGWRFVSALNGQEIIVEYHPPIKISHFPI
jgi:hypothetical protein